jgi:hypothetical protein
MRQTQRETRESLYATGREGGCPRPPPEFAHFVHGVPPRRGCNTKAQRNALGTWVKEKVKP